MRAMTAGLVSPVFAGRKAELMLLAGAFEDAAGGTPRCLGSSLARMELRVALQEWMARYPDFELSDPAAVTWSGGQVRGPRTLPVTILRP